VSWDGHTTAYASYTAAPAPAPALLRRPELAGRKRYPVKSWGDGDLPGVGEAPRQMQSVLYPLQAGAVFRGRVHFHNLRIVELGALAWALRLWAPKWGRRPDELCHSIGAGKPLGLGAVRLDIIAARLEPNVLDKPASRTVIGNREALDALDRHIDAFADHMESAYASAAGAGVDSTPTWAGSEQIEKLLGMSRLQEAPTQLDYLTLRKGKGNNQFAAAKEALETLPDDCRSGIGRQPGPQTEDQVFPRVAPASQPLPAAQRTNTPSQPPRTTKFRVGDYAIAEAERVIVIAILSERPTRYRVRFDNGEEDEFDETDLRSLK
jgi:hypothetical protein